ncbi:MAG: hypothetical protein WKF90_08545 [Pyrinomonadaceae bacterium]
MSKLKNVFSVYLTIGLIIFGFGSQSLAQTPRNERTVRNTLQSINSRVDDFRFNLDAEFSRNSVSRDQENKINADVRNFSNSLSKFENKLQKRRENTEDVSDILNAAKNIDDFLNANRFSGTVKGDWTNIRNLLDRLAANYQISANWENGRDSDNNRYPNDNRFPGNNRNPNNNRKTNNNRNSNNFPSTRPNFNNSNLTGTYQLDAARSDNPRDIANRAINNSSTTRNNADNRRDLESKLDAPEQISIDVRGNQVTLASSKAPAITFTADGRDRTEPLNDGRTLRVRGTLRGQELTIASLGGDTDYTVIFASNDNGNSMRVTRRITTEYLSQTVFAESIYNKTDQAARLGINTNPNDSNDSNGSYSSNDQQDNRSYPNSNSNDYPRTSTGRTGRFIVRDGTILTGVLENAINTEASQNNDRFRMTVNAPNEYRGAIVEGYISGINRSGKVSGRSQITFNFERISLSNGQTYDFAGFLQSVTDADGKTVRVDTEGTARGKDQTKETVTRGGIGAGLGAIIGAIAGGAKGAAIGAVIGGGAGAGSVVLQGKDDLELRAGSSITVQASSSIR